MTLQEIYDLALNMGIKADPRGEKRVKKLLEMAKKDYEQMPPKKKKYADRESFRNPYSDSRILFGDPKMKIQKVMAGIDAEASEVLLTDRLNQKGAKIDLLISHHPSGHALASLEEVMDIQIEMFEEAGVPVNVAHALFDERKEAVKRRFSPLNHSQAVDAARLLGIPLLALHTIWDNLGNQFIKASLKKRQFETVGEILDYLNEIPEFVESSKGKAGPFIVSGSEKRRTGKVVVGFTGGTNPSKELYVEMAKAGVGTIVEMHVPEDAVLELRKLHINVIDCGHMAADSIGANIFLDELEKRGVGVIASSGLIRVRRKAK
ncbi:Nif3-like dinuclear metal center hexameric protein [Patescibacteria group bacterium]|nr:Nif3-like dinuclear metal center hexameric protein [Patescibacteria group bacterium]MCL5010353.1 Nif3-like dinuclear metal center hexameric protein [Patescibacteria group bacterium]